MNAAQPTARMLIVDDFPGAAELFAEVVSEMLPGRYSFDTGINGQEAVSLAMANRPDAVLIDIEMPLMNGLEAGAAIRASLGGPPPTIIAMSGSQACLAKASAVGIFDHLMAKPIDFDELATLLLAGPPRPKSDRLATVPSCPGHRSGSRQ